MLLCKHPVPLFLALSLIVLTLSLPVRGAPAYGSADWYLSYLNSYRAPISTNSQPAGPARPVLPESEITAPPVSVGETGRSSTSPLGGGPVDRSDPNWYLNYLSQYQNVRPVPLAGNSPKNPSTSQPTPDPAPAAAGGVVLSAQEQQLFTLINEERLKAGRDPLTVDPQLMAMARTRANRLAETGTYDHNIPGLGTVGQQLAAEGYSFPAAGENLAAAASVRQAHGNLVLSSPHRTIMLDANYSRIGLGIAAYADRAKGIAVIEIFAR